MKKLYIMGCGYEGLKLFYRLKKEGYEIEGFLDNYKKGELFGKKIIHLTDILQATNPEEMLILISSEKYYLEIKAQLKNMGLMEFEHFLKGGAFGKKIAVIIGNCYVNPIATYLESNVHFHEEYFLYQKISLVDKTMKYELDKAVLENCHLCMYQDLKEDNPYGITFSKGNIERLLLEQCKKIVFPNLVGMGKMLFIQGSVNDERNVGYGQRYGLFPYRDEVIDDLVDKGLATEEIIKYIDEKEIYTKNEIQQNFDTVVEKFVQREKYWDIKIIDYILEIYKEEIAFYDVKHPSDKIMRKITEEILKILGIRRCDLQLERVELSEYEMPIYKEVAEALELNYWKCDYELRQASQAKLSKVMDWKEYVREYIFWCFERWNR